MGRPDETIFAPLVPTPAFVPVRREVAPLPEPPEAAIPLVASKRIPADDEATLELPTRRITTLSPRQAEQLLALQRSRTPGPMTVDASLELSLEALDDAAETLVMPDAAERLAALRAARVRRRAWMGLGVVLGLAVVTSAFAGVSHATAAGSVPAGGLDVDALVTAVLAAR